MGEVLNRFKKKVIFHSLSSLVFYRKFVNKAIEVT